MLGLYRCGCDLKWYCDYSNRPPMFPFVEQPKCPTHKEPIYYFEDERFDPFEAQKEMQSKIYDLILGGQPIIEMLEFQRKPVRERVRIKAKKLIEMLKEL